MSITWMMTLKYLVWILTVGTAFLGSWFFEYTTTDKETGRKKLTIWGRYGIVFAGLALVFSLSLTFWTDFEAAKKQKVTEAKAEQESENAVAYLKKLDIALTDMNSILEVIGTAQLSQEGKTKIDHTIANLSGIEDYKKHFPDLYNRIINATSLTEVLPAVDEGLNRKVYERISDKAECAVVPRPSNNPRVSGFPSGQFSLGGSAVLTFMITSDGVELGISDYSDINSLGDGSYMFLFSDDSQSNKLQCTKYKTGMSCEDYVFDDSVREVYRDLQTKLVKAIRTNTKTYEVSNSTAEDIRTTFSCVSI